MSTMLSFSEIAAQSKGDPTPQRMSVRTRITMGAIIVLFATLHAGGMTLMMSASDRSVAEAATVLRGD